MQQLLTPHALPFHPWVWWDGAFTEQELNWLQAKAKNAELAATTDDIVDLRIRRAQVSWLYNSQEAQWVFQKFADVAAKINAEHYRLDLLGFGEGLQLTNYTQEANGMYGWHQDYGVAVSRKLSMAMQLTDPSEYEGGDLQIMTSGDVQTVPKKRGLIALFPSYVLHQVTPVTKGTRQSLVAWVTGPAFK